MDNTTLKKINTLFNLPPLKYKGKAKGGFLSDNYVLEAGGQKYFLKRYRPSVSNRLPIIAKTEKFFASRDIPIILPIRTKIGKTFFAINGVSYSLFPFIASKTFDHKKDELTPKIAQSIAANLATMHLLSKGHFPVVSKEQLAEWNPEKVFESKVHFQATAEKILEILKQKKRKSAFDKTALSILKLKMSLFNSVPKQFNQSRLGKGHIVHGDYHPQNLFFDAAGNVTHVFDLEKTDIRPRSLEVARSLILVCLNGYFTAQRIKFARLYLQAYNAVYPIKKYEIEQAIRFIYYKNTLNLWIEKEHYLNHNTRPDQLLAGELRFLKYMSKNLKTFTAALFASK